MLQAQTPAPPVLVPETPTPVPTADAAKASESAVASAIDVVVVDALAAPSWTSSASWAANESGMAADAARAAAPPAAAASSARRERGAANGSSIVPFLWSECGARPVGVRALGSRHGAMPASGGVTKSRRGTDGLSRQPSPARTLSRPPCTESGGHRSCRQRRENEPRMVLAQEPRRPPGSRARPHRAPTRPRPLGAAEGGPGADEATRAAALRRIVAEVSSSQDLDRLFQEVIDASFTLFGADRAGLWIYDDSPAPLTLAAQRGLSSAMLELIASLPRDAQTVGMTAIRERHVTILAGELEGTVPRLQRMYRAEGIRSMCFVPIVFRDEVLGLLVLYHRDRLRVVGRRDRPRPLLRRPHRGRDAERPAGRVVPRARRAPRGDLRARRPAQPDPRHRRHRGVDRRRGRPAHRPRHHPGLPGRPRDRDLRADRLPGHVPRQQRPRPRHAPRRRSARASPAGWPSTTRRSRSATRAPTRAASSWAPTPSPNRC